MNSMQSKKRKFVRSQAKQSGVEKTKEQIFRNWRTGILRKEIKYRKQALKNKDPRVRRRAVFDLGVIKARSAVPVLIESLRDKNSDVRLVAAWALGNIKDKKAVPALKLALEDKIKKVRTAAAEALKKFS